MTIFVKLCEGQPPQIEQRKSVPEPIQPQFPVKAQKVSKGVSTTVELGVASSYSEASKVAGGDMYWNVPEKAWYRY